jgi:hypothetical protein
MSETLQLREPLFRLIIRFSNGETVNYTVAEPVDHHKLEVQPRSFAVITSVLIEKPNEVSEVSVVSLRDVSMIRTERVTLDQLNTERRMAGIRSGTGTGPDEKHVKSLAKLSFI